MIKCVGLQSVPAYHRQQMLQCNFMTSELSSHARRVGSIDTEQLKHILIPAAGSLKGTRIPETSATISANSEVQYQSLFQIQQPIKHKRGLEGKIWCPMSTSIFVPKSLVSSVSFTNLFPVSVLQTFLLFCMSLSTFAFSLLKFSYWHRMSNFQKHLCPV